MLQVRTDWWEVVALDGSATRFDDEAEARAAKGDGQLRARFDSVEVPAEYVVVLPDGTQTGRRSTMTEAIGLSQQSPGAQIHMVPEGQELAA